MNVQYCSGMELHLALRTDVSMGLFRNHVLRSQGLNPTSEGQNGGDLG